MEMCNEDKSNDDVQEQSLANKFSKLFSELEDCNEDEQRKKIEEMNGLIDGMNLKEFISIYTKKLLNKMNKMIEEKKMSMENTILLLKHVGYCNVLKNVWDPCFYASSLRGRFEQMIIEEEKKNEENEESLLVDLCECYFLLNRWASSNLFPVCVPCLLKVSLNKEKNEEAQKKVETALLALSSIGQFQEVRNELFLIEIKEIIQCHQKHNNPTRLAYQSSWQFLIDRFYKDKSLNEVIVNELHFAREAARELEELTKCLNWKNKFEEMSKEEANEVIVIRRWFKTLEIYFLCCQLWNEEYVGLINSLVQLFRAARENKREISYKCIHSLRNAVLNRDVKVDILLKGGAVDAVLEEIQRPTLDDDFACESLHYFMFVSSRLKEKEDDEMEEEEEEEEFDEGDEERDDEKEEEKEDEKDGKKKEEKEEAKRKATKRKVFEKLEEEGYEDTITSFYKIFDFISLTFSYDFKLSLNLSDYFVNV